MLQIPVFCNNCNIIFDIGNLFGGVGTVVMNNSSVNCPKCNKTTPIPNGTYEFINLSIDIINNLNVNAERLINIRNLIEEIKNKNTDAVAVREAININAPELSGIASSLPKTRAELYAFLGLIVLLLTFAISIFDNGKKQPIEYNEFITNNYYSSQDSITKNDTIKNDTIKVNPKIQRNSPCPCGSGKKYKFCHGKNH